MTLLEIMISIPLTIALISMIKKDYTKTKNKREKFSLFMTLLWAVISIVNLMISIKCWGNMDKNISASYLVFIPLIIWSYAMFSLTVALAIEQQKSSRLNTLDEGGIILYALIGMVLIPIGGIIFGLIGNAAYWISFTPEKTFTQTIILGLIYGSALQATISFLAMSTIGYKEELQKQPHTHNSGKLHLKK